MKASKSVVDMVQVEMSPRQKKAMQRIDAEDFDMVIYLTNKYLSKIGRKKDREYMDSAIIALKQYYATSVFDPRNMHAISSTLDPFWHSHILDTVPYEMLCTDIGYFMHHDPLNKMDEKKTEAVGVVYQYTRNVLSKIFGESNLDVRFHPKKARKSILVCRHDLDRLADTEFPSDSMPLDPETSKLRTKYSNEARRKIVLAALKEVGL